MFRKKTLTLFRRNDLYIAPSKRGRGLFTAAAIKAGETIEIAPLMVFDEKETPLIEKTGLRNYVSGATALPSALHARERVMDARLGGFIPMGATAWCNHNRDANAQTEFTDEYHTGFYILKAVKDIAPGSEICVDYGAWWFAARLEHEGVKVGKQVPVPDEFWREEGTLAASTATPVRIFLRENLYLQKVPHRGRGVFCRDDIAKGDTIEVAPVLLLSPAEVAFTRSTKLDDYVFLAADFAPEALARAGITAGEPQAAAIGIMSFCNHLRVPNAEETPLHDGHSAFFTLKAVKDIPKGTEICIDYGPSWFTKQLLQQKAKREQKLNEEDED